MQNQSTLQPHHAAYWIQLTYQMRPKWLRWLQHQQALRLTSEHDCLTLLYKRRAQPAEQGSVPTLQQTSTGEEGRGGWKTNLPDGMFNLGCKIISKKTKLIRREGAVFARTVKTGHRKVWGRGGKEGGGGWGAASGRLSPEMAGKNTKPLHWTAANVMWVRTLRRPGYEHHHHPLSNGCNVHTVLSYAVSDGFWRRVRQDYCGYGTRKENSRRSEVKRQTRNGYQAHTSPFWVTCQCCKTYSSIPQVTSALQTFPHSISANGFTRNTQSHLWGRHFSLVVTTHTRSASFCKQSTTMAFSVSSMQHTHTARPSHTEEWQPVVQAPHTDTLTQKVNIFCTR
jgi:hypothetical protein